MTSERGVGGRWHGRLGPRLALAFVSVALAGVGLLAALTWLAADGQVSQLAASQQRDTARSVAAAAGQAYGEAGGWAAADLRPAFALVNSAGARLSVQDQAGNAVSPGGPGAGQMNGAMMGGMYGPGTGLASGGTVLRQPVTAGGIVVGSANLVFPGGVLPAADQRLRAALERTVLAGAGLAVLLALIVAAVVARRITVPLAGLTAAVRRVEAGDRGARAAISSAPGEVSEVARAFDRMADTLDRQDKLRRRVLADVAHELRTPITILRASCEQMADGTDPPTPARLSSLRDEVHRLGRLVADLQTLSSAEAAGLKLVREPADLAAVAAQAADLLGPLYETAGVELTVRLEAVMVSGDATRLGQVVTNLLTNALKASSAGQRVTLSVTATPGLARLEVADQGHGIPAADLPKIFERFWRGQSGLRAGGSGIGLAVVAELVAAHRGRVEVASEPGEGARFTVLLPRT